MNFISCGCCGVILDKDRLHEPYNYKATADGCGEEIDEKNAAWDGESWAITITFPACDNRIFYGNGNEVY